MAVQVIRMINKRNRSFNGIRPGEVTEVNSQDRDAYESFGFEVLGNAITEKVVKEVVKKLDRKELLAALKDEDNIKKANELGLEIPKGNAKNDDIEVFLKSLGDEKEDNNGDADNSNLETLLTDNGVDFEDGDDLQKLAEDNGLV